MTETEGRVVRPGWSLRKSSWLKSRESSVVYITSNERNVVNASPKLMPLDVDSNRQ